MKPKSRPKRTMASGKWRLASNDGYLLSCFSSVVIRCLLMANEGFTMSTTSTAFNMTSSLIYSICIPIIMIVDLRAKVLAICTDKRPEVLTVYSTTASRLPEASNITVLESEADVKR